jgi:hypothetical protein
MPADPASTDGEGHLAARSTLAKPAEGAVMPDRAMPSFTKSPPALVERFRAVLEEFPDAQRKPMFGYPAAFVGGNMATGLCADTWIVRLPPDEIDAAKAAGAGTFEPMAGRPMKGFVVVPAADVEDDAKIRGWVERGLAFAGSMPPKR